MVLRRFATALWGPECTEAGGLGAAENLKS
jgi:hypothetical protein